MCFRIFFLDGYLIIGFKICVKKLIYVLNKVEIYLMDILNKIDRVVLFKLSFNFSIINMNFFFMVSFFCLLGFC